MSKSTRRACSPQRRACSPQKFRKATSCGGNTRVSPGLTHICQNDVTAMPDHPCYGITFEVPIFNLPPGWMDSVLQLEFELTCKLEVTNGSQIQFVFKHPVRFATSDPSSGSRNDGKTHDVFALGDCDNAQVSDESFRRPYQCSNSILPEDDHENPRATAPALPLWVKPAGRVIQYRSLNASFA